MAKLFMLLIGATPPGRHTEQHDVFFGVGDSLRDLLPQVEEFWPEAKKGMHLDAWREVTLVNGYSVRVGEEREQSGSVQLFFLNLGGYKKDEFEEFHYKMIVAAEGKGEAVMMAKQTAFFRHTGLKGAGSHIDDKYGIDVDDIYVIRDILPRDVKKRYTIILEPVKDDQAEDEIHLGYFKLDNAEKWLKNFKIS